MRTHDIEDKKDNNKNKKEIRSRKNTRLCNYLIVVDARLRFIYLFIFLMGMVSGGSFTGVLVFVS